MAPLRLYLVVLNVELSLVAHYISLIGKQYKHRPQPDEMINIFHAHCKA